MDQNEMRTRIKGPIQHLVVVTSSLVRHNNYPKRKRIRAPNFVSSISILHYRAMTVAVARAPLHLASFRGSFRHSASSTRTNGRTKVNFRLSKDGPIERREFLKQASYLIPLHLLWSQTQALPSAAKEVEVGAYLPPSPLDPSFVLFKATSKDTPALRAGNVEPYQFILPPTWKQTRVANILSGNYCQPKCAEPWVEVKFEDDKQGKVQVVASPLIRLTNKPNATIEDIGSPEKVISSLGPFVTGNTYDPDELLEAMVEKLGSQTYYKYALATPYALTGSHNLAKATAKGSTVVLFVASASDKQWQSSEKTLRAMLDSFRV